MKNEKNGVSFKPEIETPTIQKPNSLRTARGLQNLRFDESENSFTLDILSEEKGYLHLDPYDSSAKNGSDSLSTFDEANLYDIENEFDPAASLVHDVEKLGMHLTDSRHLTTRAADKLLSRTPEDDRQDLDEEGYPINDHIKIFYNEFFA